MVGLQVAAADRILRNVKRYGLMGNVEDAHYVRYTLDAARMAGLSPELQHAARRPSCGRTNVATVAAGALVLEGKSSVTPSDDDSPADTQPGGGGRDVANGLSAQRKQGDRGGAAKTSCDGGLESSDSDYLEASVQEV